MSDGNVSILTILPLFSLIYDSFNTTAINRRIASQALESSAENSSSEEETRSMRASRREKRRLPHSASENEKSDHGSASDSKIEIFASRS